MSGNQSQEGRGYIPGVGTNRRRGESIYLEWEPIAGRERVSTWSANQSQEEREYIPGVGTNDRKEEGIYRVDESAEVLHHAL